MFGFKPLQTSSIWQLPDPDNTKHMHRGRTRAELVQNIVAYRAQNALPTLHKLDMVIDNYLCGLASNSGKCREVKLQRGFLQYLRGGLALIDNLAYGEKNMVSQELADKRASICKDCPCNQALDRDMFIKWSDDMALHMVGERKVAHYNELFNCSVCSCVLRAKVWFKGPFKLPPEEKKEMQLCNPNCWQIREK